MHLERKYVTIMNRIKKFLHTFSVAQLYTFNLSKRIFKISVGQIKNKELDSVIFLLINRYI